MTLIWKLFIIIIVVGIIIKVAIEVNKKKSKKSRVVIQAKTSQQQNPDVSRGAKDSIGVRIKNLLFSVFLIILIFGGIIGIFSGIKDMVSPKEKNSYVSNVIKITDDTWIEFGPSYNKTYVLPEGIIFGFREASEPYCVINKYLAEACAEKGGNASDKLPSGSQGNLELKFKSSNGKICRLKIIIR